MAAPLLKAAQTSVILFPGQGSQYVGMAKNLCDKGRSLFEMANQVLGYDLLNLCQNGPEPELNRTIHSQPAVFVSSLAAVEKLAEMSKGAVEKCVATAGFSVGEFAALVLAQSIDYVDALRLLKLRAEASQEVCDSAPSGMLTVLYESGSNMGFACHLAREFCIRSGMEPKESICSIANDLFSHGKVIAGHERALEFIEANRKDLGIKKLKRLPVAGAFHTDFMRPVAKDIQSALTKIEIKEPKIPVYSNVDANVYKNTDQIKSSLVKHVFKPVLWQQSMNKLYKEVKNDDKLPITFECGPQQNMTTLLGMINLDAKKLAYNIEP